MARRPPPIREPIDVDEALRLYRELGTYRSVAAELGCHATTVARHLRERGEPKPPPHGCRPVALYVAWRRMTNSCRDPSHEGYRLQGARGIGVAERWERYPAFKEWALENGWKRGLVLARRNPRRDFTPANCQWLTRSDKQLGRELPPRRTVTAFGERKGALEWTRDPRCSVSYRVLVSRLYRWWYPEDALRLPRGSRAPRKRWKGRRSRRPDARSRDVDWDEVLRRVEEDGERYSDIARDLGVSPDTIRHRVIQAGIRIPPAGRPYTDDGQLYRSWTALRERVRRARRGRRGRRLRMATGWEDYPTFRTWARRAGYRRGLCLVRIDLDGDWTPENCRLVTHRQAGHHRRSPKMSLRRKPRWLIEAFGEEKGPTAWSRDRRCAISRGTLLRRVRDGWRPELAISTPAQKNGGEGAGRRPITAFGETRSLAAWLRDRRCRVTYGGLNARLKRGVPPEQALTVPPWELDRTGRGGARGRGGGRRKMGRRR